MFGQAWSLKSNHSAQPVVQSFVASCPLKFKRGIAAMRATFSRSKLVLGFKRLLSNEKGNTAIVVGMATVPLMLILGSAVDFENASNTHTELQSSVDTAALYAAALTDTSNDTLTQKAKPFFDSNFKSNGGAATPTFAVTNNGDSITATASVSVSNSFMILAGIPTTTVGATSVVKKAGVNLEVSLVLDNTGSMNSTNPQTGNSAITDLKAAAAKFVSQVMPTTQGQFYTKIAAIPYNNGVNLGSQAVTARGATLSGTSTNPGYDNYTFPGCSNQSCNSTNPFTIGITNCVTERTGTAAYTDASVATYPVGRGYLAYQGTNNPCTVQQMVPLTTSASTLTSTINAMVAGGSTAGQVGIAWGWYALSPNIGMWSGASVPAGYDKLTTTDMMSKVKKVMILMTDAEYNSAHYNGVITGAPTVSGSGGYADHINQPATNGSVYSQSASMCGAIKASGVEVYVITFQLDASYSQRVDLVTACATDSKHIIDADTTSLDSAFGTIANQIMAMRIAQ
jgi:Flp pilus assembly protein TadG